MLSDAESHPGGTQRLTPPESCGRPLNHPVSKSRHLFTTQGLLLKEASMRPQQALVSSPHVEHVHRSLAFDLHRAGRRGLEPPAALHPSHIFRSFISVTHLPLFYISRHTSSHNKRCFCLTKYTVFSSLPSSSSLLLWMDTS